LRLLQLLTSRKWGKNAPLGAGGTAQDTHLIRKEGILCSSHPIISFLLKRSGLGVRPVLHPFDLNRECYITVSVSLEPMGGGRFCSRLTGCVKATQERQQDSHARNSPVGSPPQHLLPEKGSTRKSRPTKKATTTLPEKEKRKGLSMQVGKGNNSGPAVPSLELSTWEAQGCCLAQTDLPDF
jgi:hypothetical protein